MSRPLADAFAVSGRSRLALSAHEPAILPSGAVLLEVRDLEHDDAIRLDGRPLAVAFDPETGRGTVTLDLNRSTGYHQLLVGTERRYLFGTEDAKLRIDGVVEMLAFLREHAEDLQLRWNGTLHFSGTGLTLRDARLDAAWIERRAGEVVEIAKAIARRPFVVSRARRELAREGVPDLAATARLVRRRPELVERHPQGPVAAGGERWAPRALVRRRREPALDSQGNRTVTRLLLATLELIRACEARAPKEVGAALAAHREQVARAIRLEPFATIRRTRGHLRIGLRPALEERVDERYRRGRALLRELLDERHWDPRAAVAEEWAFAALADRVYQAFAAIAIARAFELAPLGARGAGARFGSDEYEMWVDRKPPSDVLRDWRDDSSTPAHRRPDIVLRRRSDGHVAIVDAKYRTAGARALPAALTDVQLYLQAYSCTQAAIVYPPLTPGPWEPHLVSDGHYGILELPLRPAAGFAAYMRDVVRPALAERLHRAGVA